MEKIKNATVLRETLDLKDKRVLDVGCGDGALCRLMAGEGAHVTGLEPNEAQFQKARGHRAVKDERYLRGQGQDLPFAEGSFDIVVLFNSLHHIPVEAQMQALGEAARVLVSRGLVYISEPIAEGPNFEAAKLIDDETFVRHKAYECILRHVNVGLLWQGERIYNHPVKRRDFEEFRDTMIRVEPKRAAVFQEHDATLRASFEKWGEVDARGLMVFDQPTRLNLLRKN